MTGGGRSGLVGKLTQDGHILARHSIGAGRSAGDRHLRCKARRWIHIYIGHPRPVLFLPILKFEAGYAFEFLGVVRDEDNVACHRLPSDQHVIGADGHPFGGQ